MVEFESGCGRSGPSAPAGVSPKLPRPSTRVEKETGPGEQSPEMPLVMSGDSETLASPDGVVALLPPGPVLKVRDQLEKR